MADLDESTLRDRYALLCQACEDRPGGAAKEDEILLRALEELIEQELPALARRGSPPMFTDILRALRHEMVRFREFCEYPALSGKVVVGLGGSFSAGKSSLINALVGDRKCLVTEVDPTTSLPTYLVQGEQETPDVKAINLFNRLITLSHSQFRTLTHEELERYGSQVSRMLKSVVVAHSGFGWENLALLDTPGYSKADEEGSARTDASVARSQLNSAQFIIWLVPADKGTITEDDIAFLASLDKQIPKLIVISRADKHPEEAVGNIVKLVRETLAQRGIAVLDVLPFSTRPRQPWSITPLTDYLTEWNQVWRDPGFTRQFKRQFMAYENYLDEVRQEGQRQLSKFNRILTLSDDTSTQSDIQSLQRNSRGNLYQLEEVCQTLSEIQQKFFSILKTLGERLTIPLEEPDSLSILQYAPVNLQSLLQALADESGVDIHEVDPELWRPLTRNLPMDNLDIVLRRDSVGRQQMWQPLMEHKPLARLDELLKRDSTHYASLQALGNGENA
jgi:GTPase Era involved in 16S rRNA processing